MVSLATARGGADQDMDPTEAPPHCRHRRRRQQDITKRVTHYTLFLLGTYPFPPTLYALSTLNQPRILKAEMPFLRYDDMIQDAQTENLPGFR